MNTRAIPYGRQFISDEDVKVVIDALQSDYLTQGPRIKEFEDSFAQYVGSKYAVAVSNGTAALHLSALALNVVKGQKVITTPITFAASANCIKYCGGDVVFSDIDSETYLIDIDKIRQLLEKYPKGAFSGIIPVDFSGRVVDLEALRELADEFDLWIIEDACHAPGGFFIDQDNKKQFAGNGKFADLSVFSFHPVKHIACGEGGMITTNNEGLYNRLLSLRSHGIVKDETKYINSIEFANCQAIENKNWPEWYMEMQELGYNYRLTDIQAALGNSQLKRADEGLKRRREIAAVYTSKLKSLSEISNMSGVVEGNAYHLFVIEAENRRGLYSYLKNQEIYTQIHYIPTHLMPYYKQFGWRKGDMTCAEAFYEKCLSLPMYPALTENEQLFVIEKIKAFYND